MSYFDNIKYTAGNSSSPTPPVLYLLSTCCSFVFKTNPRNNWASYYIARTAQDHLKHSNSDLEEELLSTVIKHRLL